MSGRSPGLPCRPLRPKWTRQIPTSLPPGRSFSSESGQDAAGLPDGSGTDLPEGRSPKDRDDDKDAFDAG